MSYNVVTYTDHDKMLWDNFLQASKNATFLFQRNFMDYHKDRFNDFSLLIYKNEKLIAVLPANKVNEIVYSHQGLTYGGLVFGKKLKFREVLHIFKILLKYLNEEGVAQLELKLLPSFYTKFPNDELMYLMFLTKAELIRRDALSVLNLTNKLKFSKDRIEGNKRGIKNNLSVKEVDSFEEFWNTILNANLQNKHQAKPVHTLEEMSLLKKKFPKNIRQFNVYKNDDIVAGTTIFETESVAHSQYISGNSDKNTLGSLDFLHTYLLEKVFMDKEYFDFGISNENSGKNVNEGLQYWKEGFGARTITQDFYSVSTKNHELLDTVML